MATRIAIIEDNVELRQSMVEYFELSNTYDVIFSADDWEKSNWYLSNIIPDILLLDIHLGKKDGIALLSEVKKYYPKTKVIIITGDSDNKEYLLRAFQQGACSFLYKPIAFAELEKAIQTVTNTGSYLNQQLLTRFITMVADTKKLKASKDDYYFTDREVEVLELLMLGKSYQDVADILHVSYHTVNFHIKGIYLKTGVNSKYELFNLFN